VGHIIPLAGNSAEDVNAILSLKKCFVSVVECGNGVVQRQEFIKKNYELRKNFPLSMSK
jgi:hypothetical protein